MPLPLPPRGLLLRLLRLGESCRLDLPLTRDDLGHLSRLGVEPLLPRRRRRRHERLLPTRRRREPREFSRDARELSLSRPASRALLLQRMLGHLSRPLPLRHGLLRCLALAALAGKLALPLEQRLAQPRPLRSLLVEQVQHRVRRLRRVRRVQGRHRHGGRRDAW